MIHVLIIIDIPFLLFISIEIKEKDQNSSSSQVLLDTCKKINYDKVFHPSNFLTDVYFVNLPICV